jgi:aquaporin Z
MKKYITEFIGTFFLTLTIAVTAVLSGSAFAPFAIAGILIVMIYAGGHLSGAHYNPAVTLAVFLRGRCEVKDVAPYIVVQLIAAALAAFVAKLLIAGDVQPDLLVKQAVQSVLIAEFLFTFALVYVILNVATAKATSGNSYFGLAIGFAVLAGALTVGSISGGAFNPAVTTMLVVIGKLPVADCWMHLLPQIVGAILASLIFKLSNPADK